MTNTFVGIKTVKAVAMTRLAYNEYRGWKLPADENGADEGYLVEYADGGQPNHPGHAGYISWSPKAQFDAAYLVLGPLDGIPPHLQRVVAEKVQLDEKIEKLKAFLGGDVFDKLPGNEQVLLQLQAHHMEQYSKLLAERLPAK